MAKMNRIQFQPGMSLSLFLAHYGTEVQCMAALEQIRWPVGFMCPCCGETEHCVVWHDQVKTFQCSACRQQTTLTSGTIFHATKLPLRKWFQAMYFLTQSKNNLSSLELMRLMGVSYRTAWRIKHKLLQVMTEREETRRNWMAVSSGLLPSQDLQLGRNRGLGPAPFGCFGNRDLRWTGLLQRRHQGRLPP